MTSMTDKLYYSSAATSGAAAFIVAYTSKLAMKCEAVDIVEKKTLSGTDFKVINPKANVPCIVTDEGDILDEELVILNYLADKVPKYYEHIQQYLISLL